MIFNISSVIINKCRGSILKSVSLYNRAWSLRRLSRREMTPWGRVRRHGREFPASLSSRPSSTRSIFARVSARNVAASGKVRETVSASRPCPPHAIVSVPPVALLGPIGLASPRYRAERSFSPAAIFTHATAVHCGPAMVGA